MKKAIIGITGNERKNPEDNDILLSYSATGFVQGVKEAGGIPLILPIGDSEMAKSYVEMVDKIIITGGQNVSPQFYGEEKKIDSDDYHLGRDKFELAIIEEAIKQNKPLFTVCRGTQLFNVAMGGSLNQEIEHHWQDNSAEYTSQEMVTEPGSILFDIYGAKSQINSFHHQSIKDLAQNLEVIARDPKDQVIEAIKTTDGFPYLGVQWHPEFLFGSRPEDFALFTYVVKEL
ncbi:gamma-glutamyl-gamma-aminobutyrate hydrolase family protein [Streptococcus oricebi]|uniref:Gamma-glutamyl hydrolase n=1 Tax=Streptococcus oricebi TaxID=1547447 RepID=A0ABS5B337_9STRE|nr:gamma-glutamyl-gamma-aminobutyrate hydrolase family protein [Streptococcus oricebi]MBP2623248.1 gamma-glutamyl hydrolase [Streptococcus oricebi]